MKKTLLVTGATDGIGLETARMLVQAGHTVLIHGRNPDKLKSVKDELSAATDGSSVESYVADLSSIDAVDTLADQVLQQHSKLDVLINNAGILKTSQAITADGLDVRFVVNTLAPYRLTKRLAALLGPTGRVVNLSSAAQAPVNIGALSGGATLEAMDAYSQSKLAITMWSHALSQQPQAPIMIAVNPGSLLGSKMVKEGFGIDGGDLSKGAKILYEAALDDSFDAATGQYFDNDIGQFGNPHPDALDPAKVSAVMKHMDAVLGKLTA